MARVVEALRANLGSDAVLAGPAVERVYECDAYTVEKRPPLCVVLPESTEQVQSVVRICRQHGVPYAARGAGTGLSGGATVAGVVLSTRRMNRILRIDAENRMAVVQPGATNLQVTRAAEPHGLFFAPDPSSQHVSTIGGNIAENAGGPHTLKYGVTANHVLEVEMVLPNGEVARLGSKVPEAPGLHPLALVVGSEGTLGVVTEATLRLLPKPQCVRTALAFFAEPRDAVRAVSEMIAIGVVPLALEFLDSTFMRVVSESFGLDFPPAARAFLLMEFDGTEESTAEELSAASDVCGRCGVVELQIARDEAERASLWYARKNAVGGLGRIAPSKVTHDGSIPRSKLPEALARIEEIAERQGVLVANLAHAGDGNLHPCMPLDDRDPEQVARMHRAADEIMRLCVEMGGSITGEHGVGLEKLPFMRLMFSADDLDFQRRLVQAFEGFELCNPGKLLPEAGA
ncbi:MAG: FAD-binding protein [Fimbriimonadales bacterium]|nr:FAD-binding protein [Fimbriimonadales bacterium]